MRFEIGFLGFFWRVVLGWELGEINNLGKVLRMGESSGNIKIYKIAINMKTYIIDTFNKIQKYSEKLDNLSTLTNQHWVSIDIISSNKVIYIFRPNKDLLISTNGNVEKARWII